jgi:hypothetical protein
MSRTQRAFLTAAAGALLACGGGSEPQIPASLTIVSGDGQLAAVDGSAPEPLVVRVRDESGEPVANAIVSWTVVQGDATPSSPSSAADADGEAAIELSLGSQPGVIHVTASLDALAETFRLLGLATTIDPMGDDFATAASDGLVPPDLLSVGAAVDDGDLVLRLEFADAVVSDDAGGPNVVTGFVDLDVDQELTTGIVSNVDNFRPDAGDSGLGMDYFVRMRMEGSGSYDVVDVLSGITGSVTPDFDDNVLILRVPLSLLGDDDGALNLAIIVGTDPEPTDIAPDDGHLVLDAEETLQVVSVSADATGARLLQRSSTWRGH